MNPIHHLTLAPSQSACNPFASLSAYLYKIADRIFTALLRRSFFNGHFPPLPPALKRQRTLELLKAGACRLDCRDQTGRKIDALYLSSTSPKRTGNVLVYALLKPYQRFNPKHFQHLLQDGADIVLWNPTVALGDHYKSDLETVLRKLKQLRPMQKVAVSAYCASVDPSIAAVSALNDSSISLIADRGYGEVRKFAIGFTLAAQLPCVQRWIAHKAGCDGLRKIKTIPGNVLFVAPDKKADQLMRYAQGKRNFTYDLYEERQKRHPFTSRMITLPKGDHWTPWGPSVHNKCKRFLSDSQIIAASYRHVSHKEFPLPSPPSFFRRNILPLFVRSWGSI